MRHFSLKFFIFLSSLTCPGVAHAADEKWQWALSTYFAPVHSASIKWEFTYAPLDTIERDGLRLKYEGRFGGWRDHDPLATRSYVLDSDDSLLVGFRKTLGSFRTQVLVGPAIFGDTKNYPDFALGGSVIAELLWLGEGGEFAAFEARYLSVDNRWSLNHISGFPLESLSFKLGPELGVFGSDEGWGARAGVAFTGLTVFEKNVAVSLGGQVDDQNRFGPYANFYISGKF